MICLSQTLISLRVRYLIRRRRLAHQVPSEAIATANKRATDILGKVNCLMVNNHRKDIIQS